jgi:hypothetical protein
VSIDFNDKTPETDTANGHDATAFSDMTRPLIPHQTSPDQAADTAAPEDVQTSDPDAAGEPEPVVMVDPADLPEVDRMASILASKRLPLLPDWSRSLDDLKRTARFVAGHYWHIVPVPLDAFPAVPGPDRAALPGRARPVPARLPPRGRQDAEGHGIRLDAANRNDPDTYLKLSNLRDKRVRALEGVLDHDPARSRRRGRAGRVRHHADAGRGARRGRAGLRRRSARRRTSRSPPAPWSSPSTPSSPRT